MMIDKSTKDVWVATGDGGGYWKRTPIRKPRTSRRTPMFECLECGKKFFTGRTAELALLDGCPKCGGCDVDVYVPGRKV